MKISNPLEKWAPVPSTSSLVAITARIDSISPATGAEFALLPPQNSTGNWVKVVQRVPLRLALEEEAGAPPLRAGMTVTVSIDTKRKRDVGKEIAKLIGVLVDRVEAFNGRVT